MGIWVQASKRASNVRFAAKKITNWLGFCVYFVHFGFSSTFIKCLDCQRQLSLVNFGYFEHLEFVFFLFSPLLPALFSWTCTQPASIVLSACLFGYDCNAMRLIAKMRMKREKQKKTESNYFTCFHSTLSIISAPGVLLSVIGGRNNDTYCRAKVKRERERKKWEKI